MAFSTYWPRGGQLGSNAIGATSDQPTNARASAFVGQPPKILLYGNVPGTATVTFVVGTDTVRLRVTVINTTPPCEHVTMAVKEAVMGGDLIYFDGPNTVEVDVPSTPNASPLTTAFYDPNTLLIVQQSTIDGAGEIYATTRASGLPIRLTNLHGVINSLGASTNGQLYFDWRPLGSVGPDIFRLPYPGLGACGGAL